MCRITISNFAKQAGVSIETFLDQLDHAGIKGKKKNDLLDEAEKRKLLQFLNGDDNTDSSVMPKMSLKKKTIDEITQTSRTGAARKVHVEVKRKRVFLQRSKFKGRTSINESRHNNQSISSDNQVIITNSEEGYTEKKREEEIRGNLEKEVESRILKEKQYQQDQLKQERLRAEMVEMEVRRLAEETIQKEVNAAFEQEKQAEERLKRQFESDHSKSQTEPIISVDKNSFDKDLKNKRSKRDRKTEFLVDRREELHASKKRREKTKRQFIQRSGKISSKFSDQHGFEKPTSPVVHEVNVPETITVGELAQSMSIKAGEVIKVLMSMGSMVTINQTLDQDTAVLLIEEMGHTAKLSGQNDPELLLGELSGKIDEKPRFPVVTVMGHVDHGKTSLLDYLRNSHITSGEAGGITQHIGAYKVKVGTQYICFLDTPGHEAFSSMRARGAKATDLIILVVAADDGVKPQTVEAIKHAESADVPIVVAINKIDKVEADPDRVKQELSKYQVIPEEWGGDVLINEVSALNGTGIDKLLESVLLQAEMADLKARPFGNASGMIVEARLDKGRGPVATVLVQQGLLKKGDSILAGRESGRIRVLLNEHGNPITEAGPSTPVEIHGLSGVPIAGDDMIVVSDEQKARAIALHRQGKFKEIKLAKQKRTQMDIMFDRMSEGGLKSFNILVKADVQGSVEALKESLEKLSTEKISVKVVYGMVGSINESDVNLALASNSIIIGFNARADFASRKLIESEEVDVYYYNVIYDVVDLVKSSMNGLASPVMKETHIGLIEVRNIFRAPKVGAIAGCYVLEGSVRRNLPIRILREDLVIYEGIIGSLRRFKDSAQEVKSGYECGISIKNYHDIKIGDQIEVFEVVKENQTAYVSRS